MLILKLCILWLVIKNGFLQYILLHYSSFHGNTFILYDFFLVEF